MAEATEPEAMVLVRAAVKVAAVKVRARVRATVAGTAAVKVELTVVLMVTLAVALCSQQTADSCAVGRLRISARLDLRSHFAASMGLS